MADKSYNEKSKPRKADSAAETTMESVDKIVTRVTDTVPQLMAAAGAGAAIGAGAKGIRNFKRGMDSVRRTKYLGGRDPKIQRPDNL